MTNVLRAGAALAVAGTLALAGCSTEYSADDVQAATAGADGWVGEWYVTTAGDEVAGFADWGDPLFFEPEGCRELYLASNLSVRADAGSDDAIYGVITQAPWPSPSPQFGAARVFPSAAAAESFLDEVAEAAAPCADGYVQGIEEPWIAESVDISRVELGDLGMALVIDERNISSEADDGNVVVADYTSVFVTHGNVLLLAQYFDASDPVATGTAEADLASIIAGL